MTMYNSEFLQQASERGYIFQGTDLEGLDALLSKGPVTAYIGFDATADCLHAGSLLPIMLFRLFQKTGHKPLVLMGGGTTKIGDPSGKDAARQMLDDEKIDANVASIAKIFNTYLDFDGPLAARIINNKDWLEDLNYIDFLREYGPHFTINRMLTFDSVKQRLEREQPLTFLEFNYMLLQAYDFAILAKEQNCLLQMGGSDQWGNIVNGVEIARRKFGKQTYGLTTPLLTTSTGAKMGKTASGAIWLSSDRLSPYDFWQYWRNVTDADVGRFLRLFTELPMDEIKKLESLKDAEINEAKKILADEVTRILHGDQALQDIRQTIATVFEQQQGGDLSSLPSFDIAESTLSEGLSLIDLLVTVNLASSKGEARRLIRGGGARINDQPIKDESYHIVQTDVVDGVVKVSSGKKKHALAKVI